MGWAAGPRSSRDGNQNYSKLTNLSVSCLNRFVFCSCRLAWPSLAAIMYFIKEKSLDRNSSITGDMFFRQYWWLRATCSYSREFDHNQPKGALQLNYRPKYTCELGVYVYSWYFSLALLRASIIFLKFWIWGIGKQKVVYMHGFTVSGHACIQCTHS